MKLVHTILGVLLIGATASSARADDSLKDKIARQKAVQRQTDRVVLRFAAMLSVFEFHDANVGVRSRIYEDMATTLAKLSKEQMQEVVARLEAAQSSQDPIRAKEEIFRAYDKHLETVSELRKVAGIFAPPAGPEKSEKKKEPEKTAPDPTVKPPGADGPAKVRLLRENLNYWHGALYQKLAGKKLSDKEIDDGTAAVFEASLPVPVEGKIPIAYAFRSTVAVEQAKLKFRIVRKSEEKKNDAGEGFHAQVLTETRDDGQKGDFDPERGVFKASTATDAIMFFALPERKSGGGRFFLETKNLGRPELKKGDRLEFYVELYADGKPIGRSETRIKQFYTMEELIESLSANVVEQALIRDLADRQKEVFDPEKKDDKKKAK